MAVPTAVLAALLVGAAPGVAGAQAAAGGALAAGPPAFDWTAVFKLINVTSRAEPGDAGFRHEGDDTAERNEQSLRLQLRGAPTAALDWQLDYLNVKRDLAAPPAADGLRTGADLHRYREWRWAIAEPETDAAHPASGQTVVWRHGIDRAWARLRLGPVEAQAGRQPLTFGAGRVWQPTDLFAAFDPLALDTAYKPGVDALVLRGYPGAFTTATLAWVVSPRDEPAIADSAVAHLRTLLGGQTEATLVGGRVREESVAGGSVETTWLEAGWRLEALGFEPAQGGGREVWAVAGVDVGLDTGTVLLAEWYHHSLGATTEAEAAQAAVSQRVLQGRQPQLSRSVLAVGGEDDFLGLWRWAYTGFASALDDAAGERTTSLLHQLTFTYSISDNAEAVFSLITATGRGLDPATGLPRSEFGHVPDSLYVSVEVVL